jgi:type IV pilus assembly protein PilV
MQYPESRSMKSQAGFNLLEVLVAVVILSIGFLGMAGLHVFGLRANLGAQSRTQVTFLAQEIMDRMRANWSVNALGRYDQIAPVQVPACSLAGGNGCTPDQMAQNDMFEWTQALQRLPGPADAQVLPGVRRGRGIVCLDTIPIELQSTPANPSCDGGNT